MADEEKQKSTQTQSEQEGNTRPGNGDIRVLLVAVNEYKDGRVKDLGGCIADIDRIESFLKNRFGIEGDGTANGYVRTYAIPQEGYNQLMICRLENGQATYDNIVKEGFRGFLKPAGVQDRVWFHFSGHGTQSPTAEAFKNLEDGEDQCLMCHDFTVTEDNMIQNLLADKELAVLLNEVAEGDGGAPHMVVTLDCCHSGGATREAKLADDGVNTRRAEVPVGALRSLDSYLDGHYKGMVQSGAKPEVPASPHVVMTACNNLQLAGEKGGGYFTGGLIDALESVGGKISYADLQVRARAAVRKRKKNQTPQFDVLGGAKAYTRFLEGTPEGDPDKYEVVFKDGSWTVGCGAIQGLPTTAAVQKIATSGKQPIVLEAYAFEGADNDQPAAKATIKAVGPQYSTIEITEGTLNPEKAYYGMLNYFPAEPAFVQITGEPEAVQAFTDNWKKYSKIGAKNIHYITEPDPDKAPSLEVLIEAGGYRIKDHETGKFAHVTYPLGSPNEALIGLIQIVNWRRLIPLNNPDPASTLKNQITLSVNIEGLDHPVEPEVKEGPFGPTLVIRATKENSIHKNHPDDREFHFLPKITVKGRTEPLYFYLLKLWSWYGISSDEQKKLEGIGAGEEKTLEFQGFRWGLAHEENSEYAYFKLVATGDELDYHQLLQDGIYPGSRGFPTIEQKPSKGFKDWCAVTLKLEVSRES